MGDKYITKVHLKNFKGFRDRAIEDLDEGINILVGDNDTGKSTLLLAIELVLSANTNKIEAIGLDRLLNQAAVEQFLAKSDRKFSDLPVMQIDVYLNEIGKPEFDGEHNLADGNGYGMYLRCGPRDDLFEEISALISLEKPAFPFEFYTVDIKGFSGQPITPYTKPLQHIGIDNTRISNDYASRSYVHSMYQSNVEDTAKNQLRYGYRQTKEVFAQEQFAKINEEIDGDFGFSLKSSSKTNLESDLTIARQGIDIENLGVGEQCFIRTKFALSKKSSLDVVLLEEPENHLSHTKMQQLIDEIRKTSQSQVFVATHSSLVSSRLDLRNAILFGSFDKDPVRLKDLPDDTAEYFMKAPSSYVLEFALSNRNLLVEGDAEYILMDPFYKTETGNDLFGSGISVIAIGGISFPRYLDIAHLLGTKTAVVTDNDGDLQTMCVDRYEDYKDDFIKVFSDLDEARYTFEVCVYQDNKEVCEELFSAGRKNLTVQEFMLKNKSRAAFELARDAADKVNPPKYVRDAIIWLNS